MSCKFATVALGLLCGYVLAIRIKQMPPPSKRVPVDGSLTLSDNASSTFPEKDLWSDRERDDWLLHLKSGHVFAAIILATSFMGSDKPVGTERSFIFQATSMEGNAVNLASLGLDEKYTPKGLLLWKPVLYSVHAIEKPRNELDTEAVSKIWLSTEGGDASIYVTLKWASNWDTVPDELAKDPVQATYEQHVLGVNEWFWGLAQKFWTEEVRPALQQVLVENPDNKMVWFVGDSQGGAFAQACAFMFGVDQASPKFEEFRRVEFRAISFGSYRWADENAANTVKQVLGTRLLGIVSGHMAMTDRYPRMLGIRRAGEEGAGTVKEVQEPYPFEMIDPYPGFPGHPYHEIPGLWKFAFGDKTELDAIGTNLTKFAEDVRLEPCAREDPEHVDSDLMSYLNRNCPRSHPTIPAKAYFWQGTGEFAEFGQCAATGQWPLNEDWFTRFSIWHMSAKNMHKGRAQHHIFLMTVAAQSESS